MIILHSTLEERIKELIMPLLMLLLFININSCESYESHNHAGNSSHACGSSNNFCNNHLRNRIMHDFNNNNKMHLSIKIINRRRRTITTKILS